MKRILLRSIAAASLLMCLAHAATRPHYGGTLRVESRSALYSLGTDIRANSPDAGMRDAVARLLYDGLVRVDESNAAQPALAKTWQPDADFRRWQFSLREGLRLSDGSPLTTKSVVASLTAANPNWRIRVTGEFTLTIESDGPMPSLLAELAMSRNFISLQSADGPPIGTGTFRVREFQPGRKLTLEANDDHWNGRPFINAVEIYMARSLRDQAIDLQAGNADVIEVAADQIRRASQDGMRVAVSSPVDLLTLNFAQTAAVREPRVRQAISQSIDRAALQNVLLQRQGEAVASLLPQWISGYAFLFPLSDLAQARNALGGLGYTPQLTLAYDANDPFARTVAERVALNARDTGLRLQTSADTRAPNTPVADARIVHLALLSADAHSALASVGAAVKSETPRTENASNAEDMWNAEYAIVQNYDWVPLVCLPRAYGLAPRVKNWSQPRLGWMPLEDVWLEGERP